MVRLAPVAPGGMVFHVLNRSVGRMQLFSKESDYLAFVALLQETQEACPMRVCAYCLMPNHWHLLLWPKNDGDLGRYMQRVSTKHVRRWQLHRGKVGHGHAYQSRFKSFPVQRDEHFYRVARYVERNALRASLVPAAEDWQWCSLCSRRHGDGEQWLSRWPVDPPSDWLSMVNKPDTEAESQSSGGDW